MRRVVVAGARFYEIPGRKELYPSVTTVLGVISKKVRSASVLWFVLHSRCRDGGSF